MPDGGRGGVGGGAAGWDGLFVWDHVLRQAPPAHFRGLWMLLTAAALATSRIRLGPMVTPVGRRRPQQLARQVSTLDAQRRTGDLRCGLGGPIEDEYGSFGEPIDPGCSPSVWTRARPARPLLVRSRR